RVDDALIVLDLRRCAVGNQLAEVQHIDPVGDVHDQVHVVLDQKHRQAELRADLPDEGRQLVGLLGVHARSRFVQQQQLRIRGQGPGDLQPPLLAVGQGVRLLPGNVAEVHLRQQLFHPLALPRLLLPVQMEGRSEEIARRTAVHGRQHVVEHRLVLPQTDILEGPGHAHPGNLVRGGGQGVGVLPGVLALVELAHLALGVVFHDLLPPVPHRAVG
ncbi:IMPACT family member yigZ, partial [Dysosmobacter welbionis]